VIELTAGEASFGFGILGLSAKEAKGGRAMGFYLNPGNRGFQQSVNSQIYVDRTGVIAYANSALDTRQKFICVSRPRRFGKSMDAEMLAAYYACGIDSRALFSPFEIASDPSFEEHLNRHEVLFLNMQDLLSESKDMEGMITLLHARLAKDFMRDYGDAIDADDDIVSMMRGISYANGTTFVIVIDEWDCIFRVHPHDDEAQRRYLDFLRLFLKDKDYISLVWMTGILPIKKYGTHSALNMFYEFSMTGQGPLAHFTGFTQNEVAALCERFGRNLSEMEAWYNGYELKGNTGETFQIYNPRSVVQSLQMNELSGYWTSTETYEALKVYIELDYDGLRDTVTALLAGEGRTVDPLHFSNDMMTFASADDVLTLLVHLGYLGYIPTDHRSGTVFIPNGEIREEFLTAMKGGRWPEVMHAVNASKALLEATWTLDAEAVARAVGNAHLESAHLTYNSEAALAYTLSLAYYAARDCYTVIRELPTGKGFADLAFIPRRHCPDAPAMLIELKWDKGAQTALAQIKERRYPDALAEYRDNLLLVGISYDKDSREHACVIERHSD
jgi:hypothetical protein